MAKHTGGEWWILDNGSEEELAIVARRNDPFRDVAYLKREPDQDFSEVQANAQLIVAAPELLATLKCLLPLLIGIDERCTGDTAMLAIVRAIIAKAEGY